MLAGESFVVACGVHGKPSQPIPHGAIGSLIEVDGRTDASMVDGIVYVYG